MVKHPSCKCDNIQDLPGTSQQQLAALESPDVEEAAGALTSSPDSWRHPNKSQCSFPSQFFAVPAAHCGALGNALAEELLVAWFHKAVYIPALFPIALGLNHMLSFTLASKSRSRILQQRLSVPVIKDKAHFSLFQFPRTGQNLWGGGSPNQSRVERLEQREIKCFTPACLGKDVAEPVLCSDNFSFKGSNFLLFTMVKKPHVLPHKISTLLYHPLLPIYIKTVYSKHIICQQLVNQVFPSTNISH